MNDLSWMIYFASVVGGVNGAIFAVIFGSIIWFVGLQIAGIVAADWPNADYELASARRSLSFKAFPYFAAAMALQIVVPSQNTIYAIAASEYGEKALNSETGGKAVTALNKWLDKQIESGSESGKE